MKKIVLLIFISIGTSAYANTGNILDNYNYAIKLSSENYIFNNDKLKNQYLLSLGVEKEIFNNYILSANILGFKKLNHLI